MPPPNSLELRLRNSAGNGNASLLIPGAKNANDVIVRIPYEHRAVIVDVYAVKPVHSGIQGITYGRTIPLLSITREKLHAPSLQVYESNRVAFGIGQEHVPIRADGNTLWARKGCFLGEIPVPRETFASSTRDMTNELGLHVQPEHGVTFA